MRYFLAGVFLLTGCGVSEASPTSMEPIPQITTSYTYVIPPGPLVTASEGAVRGSTTLVGPEPIEPPTTVPTGLWGLPFAPEGLSNCDEMNFYRVQFGLPDRFAQLGWRESNCRNEEGVKTYCCYGYWQMYFSMHISDNRMAPRYAECEVDEISDYNGDEPLDKQKMACATKALYDVAGYSPWAL